MNIKFTVLTVVGVLIIIIAFLFTEQLQTPNMMDGSKTVPNESKFPVDNQINQGEYVTVDEVFPSPGTDSNSSLTNTSWVWHETNGPQATTPNNNRFILTFGNGGEMSSATDCNGIGGTYTIAGTSLQFGQMRSTLMYCEGSQETVYARQLNQTESYKIESGTLFLYLTGDTGVMVFKAR